MTTMQPDAPWFRKAVEADAPWIQTVGETFDSFPIEEELVEWIGDPRCTVVIAMNPELVGFAVGIRQSRTWTMLESFWVHPEHRKGGTASKLYEMFVASLPPEVDFLTTMTNVQSARRVMKLAGFKAGPSYQLFCKELKGDRT